MAPQVKDKYLDRNSGLIATAPYNFVSLPTDICVPKGWNGIAIDQYKNGEALHDTYLTYVRNNGVHSGYIEVDITTKTHTLVGGYGENSGESSFFSIHNEEPMIPGSSLRGMVRNLFKVVTASSFREGEDFTEKSLYYRGVASSKHASEAQSSYMNSMQLGDRNTKAKDLRKRGFLVRSRDVDGVHWHMYLCASSSNEDARTTNQPTKKVNWENFDRYKKIDIVIKCLNAKGRNRGKNNKYVFKWNKATKYAVPNEVIEAYKSDERRKGLDVLTDCAAKGALAAKYTGILTADLVAPCFFTLKNNQVIHFGAPLYYRIPYTNPIGAHVPKTLKSSQVDFADLVFGLKEYWGGRLSFGDAKLSEASLKKGNYLDKKMVPVALLGPNPTSFQLYLDQEKSDKRLHWNNTDATIRGVKQYWHRDETENKSDSDQVTTKCKHRVKPGVTFTGKVYFKSLTSEELGALCKVLFLGTGSHGGDLGTRNSKRQYKIGKGKSIGWGSVSITSKLFLEREDTYTSRAMWSNEGIVPMYKAVSTDGNTNSVDALIATFDIHAKQTMGNHYNSLQKAMNELYIMMDPNALGSDKNKKTDMMRIGNKQDKRFVDRTALLPVEKFKKVSLKGNL